MTAYFDAIGKTSLVIACSLLSFPVTSAILEEVIVTATKREESLQDVPISVTAFNAEAIETLGFDTSYEFSNHVPNLVYIAESTNSTPFIFLRGVGNTGFYSNSIKPVAVYVDQTFVGPSISQGLQLFDLDRIEVLRGPQGTLFGRNATGGLVNFVTRRPEIGAEPNARVELTGGDFGQFDVEAAGSVPLGESAAARFAVSYESNDGMWDNVTPGYEGDVGAIDRVGFRGQLAWQLTSEFELLFKAHYGDDNSENPGGKPGYVISPFGVPNCPPGAVSGALNNGCSDPFGTFFTPSPGLHETDYTYTPDNKVESYGFMLEANWDIGNFTITSLTAWDSADRVSNSDDDASPRLFLKDNFLADAEWFSQELRLTTNFDGPLNWIAGFNYYSDELDNDLYFSAIDLRIPGFPPSPGIGQRYFQESESWAVFGEATWDFIPDWTLRLGLRLTDDERKVSDFNTFVYAAGALTGIGPVLTREEVAAAFIFPLVPHTDLQDDWFEWSGRAALEWRFAEDQMLYASASRGVKGGEFNGGALFDLIEVTISDPEFTDSYEIGYKGAHWDNRLQFNMTGFFMEYKDQQTLVIGAAPGGFLPVLENAGASEMYGFEFDLTLQPNEHWLFLLGGGYLDAEFKEFFVSAINVDRAGNKLPHSPEWNFNGVIRYETPIADGTLGLQLDWWWQDEQVFTSENEPVMRSDDRGMINARASYTFMNDRLELALFVKNLTEEKFVNTGFNTDSAGFGAFIYNSNEPRTFGGQIVFNYN